jgi:hypothetical protein
LKSDFLGPREINSGLTLVPFINGTPPTIVIFREEEIEKVLLHELVHATKHDRSLKNPDSIDNDVKCIFNISKSTQINFGETYTETVALIINSIFNSILQKIPIEIIIKNEIKFSIIQCSKIMNFYGITNINKFFCDDCCFIKSEKTKWIEKTSVLSYFFLKTANILNLDYFIKNFWMIDGLKTDEFINSKNIFNFIKETFSKHKNLFLMGDKKIKKNRTLRMTLYDFEWDI